MKFLLFGTNEDRFPNKISVSKAELVSSDLDKVLDMYESAINNFKYKHSLIICDFEADKHLNYEPYYVTAENHIGKDQKNIINKYKYIVEDKGFTRIFVDPLEALKEFLGYINNGKYVRLSIIDANDNRYIKGGYDSVNHINIVADSILVMNPSNRITYNKKYKLATKKPNIKLALF